jgi:lipopolysaccharide transport system ATP-binding protein
MDLNSARSKTTDTSSEDTKPVIRVCNVSKMYPLYSDPRDRLKQSLWYALPEFLRGKPRSFYREFWALRNISFEINEGESVGIIGRNGSGKSTLLQIIAGTLAPTQGEVLTNGRIAALLELGSGFNPEFTGRENVYLNGAIWGLSRTEVDELYDDIVTFADIGQFIDQPVKLYSSGMVVRLAFAVQVFVPKQVLIVDEALSVGDEAFQRKCMATLEQFQDNGGTVLLVSHGLQTVVHHCQRCLLLHQGELLVSGPSKPVTDLYQKIMYSPPAEAAKVVTQLRQHGLEQVLADSSTESSGASNGSTLRRTEPNMTAHKAPPIVDNGPQDGFDPHMPIPQTVTYGNGEAKILEYGIYNEQGKQVNILITGRHYHWQYLVHFYQACDDVQFGMLLRTRDGVDVAAPTSKREGVEISPIPAGMVLEVTFSLRLNIVPGTYFLNAGVSSLINGELTYLHRLVDACMFRVLAPDTREMVGIAYVEPEFKYHIHPVKTSIVGLSQ